MFHKAVDTLFVLLHPILRDFTHCMMLKSQKRIHMHILYIMRAPVVYIQIRVRNFLHVPTTPTDLMMKIIEGL